MDAKQAPGPPCSALASLTPAAALVGRRRWGRRTAEQGGGVRWRRRLKKELCDEWANWALFGPTNGNKASPDSICKQLERWSWDWGERETPRGQSRGSE